MTNPVVLLPNVNGLTDLMPSDPALTDTTNRDLVLVRVLGNVHVEPDTTFAQVINWAQGILPITRQAFAAGAVPLPQIDQPGWSYMQAGRLPVADLTVSGQRFIDIELDVKSQRRIPKSGNVLFHIIRNLGLTSIEFQLHLRVLYRLP